MKKVIKITESELIKKVISLIKETTTAYGGETTYSKKQQPVSESLKIRNYLK